MGATFTIRGVVIASRPHRDQDAIITILTPKQGLVSVMVPGAKKHSSRLASLATPPLLADMVLSESKSFYYLKEGETVESFRGLYDSFEGLTSASHILEVVKDTAIDPESSQSLYPLLLYVLYDLSKHPEKYRQIVAAFEWRVMDALGFAFDLNECDCGKPDEMPTRAFSFSKCRLYCSNIRCVEKAKDYQFVSLGCVEALRYIREAPLERLSAFRAEKYVLDDLCSVTHRYLCERLEKNYDKMAILDTLPPL
ncbi:MAG: DNA repair protein RecO [Clostridiales bacterium]|nr:DNA repair protein RecO [Clostridiales bacterium]MBR4819217.1 DNA repair protein RecO [Clostridiales bacterium]